MFSIKPFPYKIEQDRADERWGNSKAKGRKYAITKARSLKKIKVPRAGESSGVGKNRHRSGNFARQRRVPSGPGQPVQHMGHLLSPRLLFYADVATGIRTMV
jgi:hypothetical protein